MSNTEWPRGLRRSDARPIGAYLKWISSLCGVPQATLAREALAGIGTRYSADFMLELFQIWRKLVPPPRAVSAFLIEDQNQIKSSFVMKLALPADQSQILINLIRNRGYQKVKLGLAIDCGRRNDKGPWHYILKRTINDFAGPHLNCLYAKKTANSDSSLASFFPLDVVFPILCHRVNIIEMLKAKWISLWAIGFRLETVIDPEFVPGIDEELERTLQTAGIVNSGMTFTAGVQCESSGLEKRSLRTNPSLKSLFARLLCYDILAIASVLIERYHYQPWTWGRPRSYRWYIENVDSPRLPYVLIYPTSPVGDVEVQIWPRHRPIVIPNSVEATDDSHPRDLYQHLQTLRERLVDRKFIEMYDAIAKVQCVFSVHSEKKLPN